MYEKQNHILTGKRSDGKDNSDVRTHKITIVPEIMGKNPLKAAFKRESREFAFANFGQTAYDDLIAQDVGQQVGQVIQANQSDILRIKQPLLLPKQVQTSA